jgi:hypothetical protein
VRLCRELNERGARYVVIGGMAINQPGLVRATEDIGLLIESSRENQERVRSALEMLPDKAVREVLPDDLDNYLVVRVADEIVVDLMLKACGITYEAAAPEITIRTLEGVPIPFASAKLMLRLKETHREKVVLDRIRLTSHIRFSVDRTLRSTFMASRCDRSVADSWWLACP